jgi:hypothetical protein
MSETIWSSEHYKARERQRAATNEPVFKHDAAMAARPRHERKVHEKMDPYKVTRESRDSRVHPESRAIGIVIDNTGSMQEVPVILQRNLPNLMDEFVDSGIEPHAQVMISSVGDATCDDHMLPDGRSSSGSLQVGQFESGIEIDQDLERIWRVGGGGGQRTESYQNILYFYGYHTSIDCFEKRGEKGFLFVIGDEMAYPQVSRTEANLLFGDTLQEDIPLDKVLETVKRMYHVFFLIPQHTLNGRSPDIQKYWVELMGAKNVILLEHEEQICDVITSAVAATLGRERKAAAKKTKKGVTRLS